MTLLLALLSATTLGGALPQVDSVAAIHIKVDSSVLARMTNVIYSGRDNQLKVSPPQLSDDAINVDGRLDEPQWAHAALLTGFSQFYPLDNIPADDSAQVLVWYSPNAIYFGIRAFESHGAAHATLADRDKILSDDWVQVILSTYNDARQATVFGVNPLGVQMDGILLDGAPGKVTLDFSPDYVYQSKGVLTSDGFVIEMRIPFKSISYQKAPSQTWGIHIIRYVQHSQHEESWTPARRASSSFLAQGGTLDSLANLHRGLVLDVNPEATARSIGSPGKNPGDPWHYDNPEDRVGGNVRWGISNNLTLNGTVRPDFSQIESDAGQLSYDPRQALFFPEKRPFFLDGLENFATPHQLVYTRRIVEPTAAVKLTGKLAGSNIAFLNAVDGSNESFTGRPGIHPVFDILRVQRDLGAGTRLGTTLTDRSDASLYNRMADVDGATRFAGVYTLDAQYAQSWTDEGAGATSAPLWRALFQRNGQHYLSRYLIDAVHRDFQAQSGFIQRPGIVTTLAENTFRLRGKPGAFVENVDFIPAIYWNWNYDAFMHQRDGLEKKYHVDINTQLRGGWFFGAGIYVETFGFDPQFYSNYRILRAEGDTLPFRGTGRIPNHDYILNFATPTWSIFSANGFVLGALDEDFYEWAMAKVWLAQWEVDVRPTDKLRGALTYTWQKYIRPSDNSVVEESRIPRLKVEYQIARPLFVRLVGEFDSFYQDSLRDEGRTFLPLLIDGQRTVRSQSTGFRGDFLFSYTPMPGTVFFAGYGAGFDDQRANPEPFQFPGSLGFRGMARTTDAFFVKASYLYRF